MEESTRRDPLTVVDAAGSDCVQPACVISSLKSAVGGEAACVFPASSLALGADGSDFIDASVRSGSAEPVFDSADAGFDLRADDSVSAGDDRSDTAAVAYDSAETLLVCDFVGCDVTLTASLVSNSSSVTDIHPPGACFFAFGDSIVSNSDDCNFAAAVEPGDRVADGNFEVDCTSAAWSPSSTVRGDGSEPTTGDVDDICIPDTLFAVLSFICCSGVGLQPVKHTCTLCKLLQKYLKNINEIHLTV